MKKNSDMSSYQTKDKRLKQEACLENPSKEEKRKYKELNKANW